MSISRLVSAHWLSQRRVSCITRGGVERSTGQSPLYLSNKPPTIKRMRNVRMSQHKQRGGHLWGEKQLSWWSFGSETTAEESSEWDWNFFVSGICPENDLRKPTKVIWSKVNVDWFALAKELQFHFHVRHFCCLYKNIQYRKLNKNIYLVILSSEKFCM